MTTTTGDTAGLRQRRATNRQGIAHGYLWLAVCLCAPVTGAAFAQEAYQSQDALHQSARYFLEAQLPGGSKESAEIVLGHFDPRLHLKACDTPLQAFLPAGAKLHGRLNVGIRCPDAKPWTVYLSADIKIFSEVAVAARPLSRGETIREGDTIPLRMEVSKLNSGYYLQGDDLDGKILRQSIPAGRPLTPSMLRAPLMVRRGEDVTIIAAGVGLQVRMKGKALEDAALGERVSVQNLRSKRIVEGTAVEPGQVQVLM